MDYSDSIDSDLDSAEELLHCGHWQEAHAVASRVLSSAATPTELTRAFFVLLQVDFQAKRSVSALWAS